MITPASFRVDYTEFADVAQYPVSGVAYWINLATILLSPAVWGASPATATNPPTALIDIAIELFTAHNLVLEKQAVDAALNAAAPGLTQGPVASMSVGGVSISYDTSAGIETDAGHWNLTTYGLRLFKLMGQMGTRPISSVGMINPSPLASQNAWPGPPFFGFGQW